jgi:hypothetical protein
MAEMKFGRAVTQYTLHYHKTLEQIWKELDV